MSVVCSDTVFDCEAHAIAHVLNVDAQTDDGVRRVYDLRSSDAYQDIIDESRDWINEIATRHLYSLQQDKQFVRSQRYHGCVVEHDALFGERATMYDEIVRALFSQELIRLMQHPESVRERLWRQITHYSDPAFTTEHALTIILDPRKQKRANFSAQDISLIKKARLLHALSTALHELVQILSVFDMRQDWPLCGPLVNKWLGFFGMSNPEVMRKLRQVSLVHRSCGAITLKGHLYAVIDERAFLSGQAARDNHQYLEKQLSNLILERAERIYEDKRDILHLHDNLREELACVNHDVESELPKSIIELKQARDTKADDLDRLRRARACLIESLEQTKRSCLAETRRNWLQRLCDWFLQKKDTNTMLQQTELQLDIVNEAINRVSDVLKQLEQTLSETKAQLAMKRAQEDHLVQRIAFARTTASRHQAKLNATWASDHLNNIHKLCSPQV